MVKLRSKSLFIKIVISLLFLFFSYLQYNDSDNYIWISIYCSVSILVFLNERLSMYVIILLLSICSAIFINNIHSILTSSVLNDELFYEIGGIVLILILSYFKLTKQI